MSDENNLSIYLNAEEQIVEQKKYLKNLNYSNEKLVDLLAMNMVYLKMCDDKHSELLARHISCRECKVKNLSIPLSEKELAYKKIIELARPDASRTFNDAKKVMASHGGTVKAKKDKDGKQKAKSEVKGWWKRWQSEPKMYRSKAEFAKAMLDKFDGTLTSQKKIEDWCREWEKSPC